LQGAAEQHKAGQVGSCEPPAVTAGGGGRRGRGQAHPPVPRPPSPRLPPARPPRPSLPPQDLPDAAAASSCHRTAAVPERGRVHHGVRGDPGHVFPDVVSESVVSARLRRAVSFCREADTLKRRQVEVSLCCYGICKPYRTKIFWIP
jgi:hypothetical protein